MVKYLTGREALVLMLVHEYEETNELVQAANRPPCVKLHELFAHSIREDGKGNCAWDSATRKRILENLWQKLEVEKSPKQMLWDIDE